MMTSTVNELDELETPPTLRDRVKRVLAVPGRLLGALFLPDRTLPRVVTEGRYGAALLFVMLCAALSAWTVGQRIDMSMVGMGPPPGAQGPPPEPMSDREIDETIQKETTKKQVALGLDVGVLIPLKILLVALGILLIGRYVGGKTSAKGALSAASHGALPFAVKSLLTAGAALGRTAITPMQLPDLVPFSHLGPAGAGPLKVLVFDPFVIWAAVIVFFALLAASHMSRRKAFVTVLVCFVFYQLLSGGAGPEMPGGPMMQGPNS